jgi:uncharacterized membrane protein
VPCLHTKKIEIYPSDSLSEKVVAFDNFPRKLRQEVKQWRDEGLISSSQYEQLASRYQFKNLDVATRDRSTFIAIIIGSILLSLGVITLVAANWQTWSREVQFILMLSLFFSTTITGFLTWRDSRQAKAKGNGNSEKKKEQRNKELLGEGLLFLGALVLGANIALMAQIFNISGSSSELFIAWGFGVLVMAYSLSLTSLGILAIGLVQVGYWLGLNELWNPSGELTWARLAVRHMPLISWVSFIPLGYFCRSRWIFAIAASAFASSLQFNLNPLQPLTYSSVAPWAASFAFTLPPALFWSYDDLLFPTINYRLFQPLARTLAVVFFGVLFYLLSFSFYWEFPSSGFSGTGEVGLFRSISIIDVGVLSGLAVLQWLFLFRHRNNQGRQVFDIITVFVISFIATSFIVPFWHQAVYRIGALGVFAFNILLGILAFGLIREGLKKNSRRLFWGGMLLLTLQINSRMIEYDTDLLSRSVVFFLCGWGLISTGLWFERRLTSSNSSVKK